MLKTDFTDSEHWLRLAERHLSSYTLPNWHEKCSSSEMEKWLYRLDMDEKDYKRLTNTSLEDFIKLNPRWPLRAFVGLLLEIADERENENAGG